MSNINKNQYISIKERDKKLIERKKVEKKFRDIDLKLYMDIAITLQKYRLASRFYHDYNERTDKDNKLLKRLAFRLHIPNLLIKLSKK